MTMLIPVAVQKERPSMQHISRPAQRRPWMHGLALIAMLAALASWLPVLAAGPATLLKNINTSGIPFTPDNSSLPQRLIAVGTTLYFSANDGVSGIELWKSDGTPAGTVQVKDIYPGAPDAELSQLANINGTLLFAANDGTNGVELWKSKGTLETTLLVQDIASAAGASNPAEFTLLGTSALFRANDDSTGSELWSLPIGGLNFAPVAGSTTFSTGIDTPVGGTLPASDPDGNSLSFSIVANGTKGSPVITNAATGAFTYTPNAGATGTDSFSFKVSDGQLESNVATVTVTIGNPKVYLPLIVR
jgi:ELWxxDGT repeat protein